MTKLISILVCGAALLFTSPLHAVDITAPTSGTTFAPGATVNIRVTPSSGEQITEVSVTVPGGIATDASPSVTVAGAFEAQITVPTPLVGPVMILAYAKLADGTSAIDFVDVNVEPGAVTRLTLSAPPTMGTVGKIFQLQVKALFADGITRDVTLPERGTAYLSSNEAVLGIHPTGLIQARTNGVAVITATNRGKSVTQIVQVTVPNPPSNRIPIADAGADQTVAPNTLVTLSAANSSDPDGDPLTYHWEQTGGRIVLLRTPDLVQPVFVSPRVDTQEVLEFSLVVSDNKGATTFPAIVRVTVAP